MPSLSDCKLLDETFGLNLKEDTEKLLGMDEASFHRMIDEDKITQQVTECMEDIIRNIEAMQSLKRTPSLERLVPRSTARPALEALEEGKSTVIGGDGGAKVQPNVGLPGRKTLEVSRHVSDLTFDLIFKNQQQQKEKKCSDRLFVIGMVLFELYDIIGDVMLCIEFFFTSTHDSHGETVKSLQLMATIWSVCVFIPTMQTLFSDSTDKQQQNLIYCSSCCEDLPQLIVLLVIQSTWSMIATVSFSGSLAGMVYNNYKFFTGYALDEKNWESEELDCLDCKSLFFSIMNVCKSHFFLIMNNLCPFITIMLPSIIMVCISIVFFCFIPSDQN